MPRSRDGVETVIGHGESWAEAIEDIEWADGDVLVVGSSSIGPVARVFLGSRASKIVRVLAGAGRRRAAGGARLGAAAHRPGDAAR